MIGQAQPCGGGQDGQSEFTEDKFARRMWDIQSHSAELERKMVGWVTSAEGHRWRKQGMVIGRMCQPRVVASVKRRNIPRIRT